MHDAEPTPPRPDTESTPRRLTRRLLIGSALAATAAAVVIAVVAGDAITREAPDTGLATATIDDITDTPELYAGQTVTVVGQADQPRATEPTFVLQDDDLLFADRLVVVNATGETIDVVEDDAYRARGSIRVFDPAAFTIEPGLDLDFEAHADLDGQPVLIATHIEPTAAMGAVE